ncbi:LRR-GTPase of the ROCO family, putative pseudogene [Ectocarpus siliculosus]|nr:LRR-GTPase of the ROCO family, putative pseudogene [Ectocarpus siliculosus]|eukprot:CBJ33700.1 LRR-GTPase of the ROCO family, putative pseudogene [Ectocarpus siliculosus]
MAELAGHLLLRVWVSPIPPELGKLGALKTLALSGNKLDGPVPPALGKLAALRNLYLYGNQLSGLIPPELGKLGALKGLNLSINKLDGPIPLELGHLSALEELALSGNQLSGPIPPALGKLAALQALYLHQNQLSGNIPPELGDLRQLQWLRLSANHLTGLRVCDWLRSISRRVPGNDVILVATKCDLVSGVEETGQRIELACRTWLSSWVRNGMNPVRLEPHVSLTSCFPIGVGEHGESSTGSNASKQGWACDWRDVEDDNPSPSLLYRLINKPDEGGPRGVQNVLPRSWDIALTFLDSLEHGRDPMEMVLHKSPNSDRGATETAVGKTTAYQGITVEELSAKWQETVDELRRRTITVTNAENALEGALSIREFDGFLVRHEKFVFLDVVLLAKILKPLLNHKDQEAFDGHVYLGDTDDTRITLDDPSDIASWDRLKEGVLEPRLADAMWPDGLSEYVLRTLASLGLTFPLENDPAEGLVVLLRLKPHRPESSGKVIDTFCSGLTPAFRASWKIFLGVPPGAVEKVLTRCCGLRGVQTFWRYGVLVHGGLGVRDERRTFAVVVEYSSIDNELVAQIFGDISTPGPWMAMSYVMSAVSLMLVDFPGLRWKGSLKCPQHGDGMLFANKATRDGDKFLEGSRCPQCSADTGGLGDAAIDLLRLVDIRLDRDVIFNEVKARFDDLKSQYCFACPAQDPSRQEGELIREIVATAVKGGFAEVEEEINNLKVEMKGGFNEVKGDTKGGFNEVKAEVKAGFTEVEGGFTSMKGEMKEIFDEMKGEVKGGFDDTNTELRDVKDEVEGGFGDTVAGLRKVKQEVQDGFGTMQGTLDKVLESTQESLMRLTDLQTPNYRYPRLVVVKEAGIGDRSLRATGWKRFLPSKLRGVGKKDMTLHFLCPVDMTKVPCGYGGDGYRFQETRAWVKEISPVLQVAVVTAKVALNATTGLNVDISDFLKDLKNGLVEELVDRTLDEDALLHAVLGEDSIGADLQRDTRASYEALKVFMENEERRREEMKRHSDGRGGMVWVRNDNVQKWLDSHSTAAPTR